MSQAAAGVSRFTGLPVGGRANCLQNAEACSGSARGSHATPVPQQCRFSPLPVHCGARNFCSQALRRSSFRLSDLALKSAAGSLGSCQRSRRGRSSKVQAGLKSEEQQQDAIASEPSVVEAPPLSDGPRSGGDGSAGSRNTLFTRLASQMKGLSQWQKGALLAIPALPAVFAGFNFDGPSSVAQALLVLGAIVTFHECGHFLAARLQNIPVSQFVIGFGPTLYEWKGKEVDYKLKALPLGGYVAFPDDDPASSFQKDDPRLLKNRPIHQRALVISAGVIANAILAYAVLFTQVQTVGYTEQHFLPGVVVGAVLENSSARRGGVHRGDIILSIDEQKIKGGSGATSDLVEAIKQRPEREIVLAIRREGELMDLKVKAERDIDGAGRIGVQLRANDEIDRKVVRNPGRALELASLEWRRLVSIVLDGLKQVFFNFGGTADKLSGPVAIVALGADVARSDVTGLFQFAALININLAIVNLLPLPALDGGYLALLLVEGLRGGKKLPDGLEQRIMASGLLLLLTLGVFLTVKDTLNLDFIKDLLGV